MKPYCLTECNIFRVQSPVCNFFHFGYQIVSLVPVQVPKVDLSQLGNDLDAKITSVPGMGNFLQRRDLPSFCQNNDLNDPIMQHVLKEDQELPRAQANKSSPQVNSSNSLWEDDRSCMTWLDAQPPNSVIYVNVGSLAVMKRDQLMEIWHGLVNSGKRFLWVRRLGSVAREDDQKYETPTELSDATKERGCIVSWVQQEEVLGHPSIGAFLTHSGWNSTLESIVEGVPMICWPYFVDQQVNSRFVGEVWRIGVDMKDSCDRGIIEKMIRDVMEVRKDEFQESVNVMVKLARQSVCEGGSSYYGLDRLIKDIKKISLSTSQA